MPTPINSIGAVLAAVCLVVAILGLCHAVPWDATATLALVAVLSLAHLT